MLEQIIYLTDRDAEKTILTLSNWNIYIYCTRNEVKANNFLLLELKLASKYTTSQRWGSHASLGSIYKVAWEVWPCGKNAADNNYPHLLFAPNYHYPYMLIKSAKILILICEYE
jgi:hypothetical protein